MLTYQTSVGDLKVNVNIESDVACFRDDSGIGKTYLFSILFNDFSNERVCLLFNYEDAMLPSHEEVKSRILARLIGKAYLVIFDNADLYLDQEILDRARGMSEHVLFASRAVTTKVFVQQKCFYTIDFDKDSLTVRKI